MKYFVILRNYQLIPNRNGSISQARLQNAQNTSRRVPTYLFASNRHCVAQLNYPIVTVYVNKNDEPDEKPERKTETQHDERKKRIDRKTNAKREQFYKVGKGKSLPSYSCQKWHVKSHLLKFLNELSSDIYSYTITSIGNFVSILMII